MMRNVTALVGAAAIAGSLIVYGGALALPAAAAEIPTPSRATAETAPPGDSLSLAPSPSVAAGEVAAEPTPAEATPEAAATSADAAKINAGTTAPETGADRSATDPEDETNPADEAPVGARAEVVPTDPRTTASIALSRVSLTDGEWIGSRGSDHLSDIVPTVTASTADVFAVTGSGATPDTRVAFQVNMLDTPTGYWALMRVFANPFSESAASCFIYRGNPRSGGVLADTSPFTCDSIYGQGFPDARYTFAVGLNRAAEAAGVIATSGPVSLTAGHFESDLPYHVDGAAVVDHNSSTRFETVLRDGDRPINAELARMEFVYRIADAGTATTFWVAGWSQNFRGIRFAPEAKCAIYNVDPVAQATPLAKLTPDAVTPYTCTMTSRNIDGWRGAYEATFTVAKRQMTVISQPLLQKELVDRFCRNAANCGLSLATVTDAVGPGRIVSEIVTNSGDSEITPTKTTSSSQTITNSGGFDIEITAGGGSEFLGLKYEVTLKTHYSRSVSDTTTTSTTIPFRVPPRSEGWLEGTPPMIHTVGDIVVKDGARYYLLTNVVADFPDASPGAAWRITTRSKPITVGAQPPVGGALPPVLGAQPPAGPGTAPLIPVSAAPTGSIVTGGATAADARPVRGGLAATGASADGMESMLVVAVALLGVGLLVLIHARRRRA